MGHAIELLSGLVTAPSTTLTALTMATGNSLTVRNTQGNSAARLVTFWTKNQTAGVFRIKSPKMHDDVQGIRVTALAADPTPLVPPGMMERLFSQDTLSAVLSGSATAADIELAHLLIQYDDLPGISGRFFTPEAVMSRMDHLITVPNTLALGTAGGYSGEEAINAEQDLFRANEDYALVGYEVSVICGAIRWRGQETGNTGIGGPGLVGKPQITRDWFIRLSKMLGKPAIPVFNAANKASILIDGVQDENGTDVLVHSIFAHLGP